MSSECNWVFEGLPNSGARKGGNVLTQLFKDLDANPIDTFIREAVQNSRDQRFNKDEAVSIAIALHEISGADLDAFLEAIGWDELEPHLRAMASKSGAVEMAPRIGEALDEIDAGRLRVLTFSDSNTRGLTGAEDDAKSNFNALCRNELVTSEERQESGGSYGVGKAVHWLMSGMSTVFFHSVDVDEHRPRTFGRSILAYHETEGEEFEGSGWHGVGRNSKYGWRAESIRDEPASTLASSLLAPRSPDNSGTSIIIVGFDNPAELDEPDALATCQALLDACNLWFWPAIFNEDIRISVKGFEGSTLTFEETATGVNSATQPFVEALTATPAPADKKLEAGDVIERVLSVDVPAQTPKPADLIKDPMGAYTAEASLRIRLSESSQLPRASSVALVRGSKMVVKYLPINKPKLADLPYHAVLSAGKFHGDDESDAALERFLRAAEPAAHSEWWPRTERIKAVYRAPKKTLDYLWDSISKALLSLVAESEDDSTDGPDLLKKRFELPGNGVVDPPLRIGRLVSPSAVFDGTEWQFEATWEVLTPPDAGPNRVKFSSSVDQEGTGSRHEMSFTKFDVATGDVKVISSDSKEVVVEIPAHVDQVEFSGSALAAELKKELRQRVGLVLTGTVEKGS